MPQRRDTSEAGQAQGRDPGYRLKVREEIEDERLSLLEQIFDPASRRRRDLGQPGWRCLEVGVGPRIDGGGGSPRQRDKGGLGADRSDHTQRLQHHNRFNGKIEKVTIDVSPEGVAPDAKAGEAEAAFEE